MSIEKTEGRKYVFIEILSVSKKKDIENDPLPSQSDSLRQKLGKYGFDLNAIKKTVMHPTMINSALNGIAKSDEKPDVVIIANALTSKDSKSFRKYFVETVVAAERAENTPAPKDYWKKRNKAFAEAKREGADDKRLEELEEEFRLTKKKAKVFSLGDFGNGYKGYCFMYKGVRVAAIPKAELTGVEFGDVAALAAVRTAEVFKNSAEDYPDGFSVVDYVPPKTGFANQFIPMKGDGSKEIIRKCITIAAFLVFLAAFAMLFYNMFFLSYKNAQLNGEIQKIAHGVSDTVDDQKPEVGDTINWSDLEDINDEIVGWIQIDNTVIDYPVLWHKGDDRTYQYYLAHNYRGEYDAFGSIFVDYRCPDGAQSKNVVLHGHHMNDGSMFGNLLYYGGTSGDLDFYSGSPTVRFDTPEGDGVYKIISVFKTNTLSSHGEFFNYMMGEFQNEKDFMNYVYNVRIRSMINCPVDVNEDDKLLTLSTCSYEYTNFRTVVVARKVRDGESPKVDVSKASLNDNAVWPQVYYSARGGTRPEVTDFVTAYEAGEIDWYNGDYDFKDQKVIDPNATTAPSSTKKDDESGGGDKDEKDDNDDKDEKNDSESSKSEKNDEKPKETEAEVTQPIIYLTVKFINYDGSEIDTQQVEYGHAAEAPEDPEKPSDEYYDYVFQGWGLDFDKVEANLTIAPVFEPVLKPEYADQE